MPRASLRMDGCGIALLVAVFLHAGIAAASAEAPIFRDVRRHRVAVGPEGGAEIAGNQQASIMAF